jgi:hypothetical protein
MENVSAEPNIPSPETTWAVLLGASVYPKSSGLADLPVSVGFFSYLIRAFRLSTENVLDLFDSDELPANQIKVIVEWLSNKQDTLKDLILFYSGYGSFRPEVRQWFLSPQTTRRPWEDGTSIGIVDLFENARNERSTRSKILDF